MAKVSNGLKTGAAVMFSVLVLLGIFYRTGDLSFGSKGYTVKTQFGFTAGLKKLAPVNLAGVEVGEVQELNLQYHNDATVVEAVIWLEEGVKLKDDSIALISTLGLMGEKYIEISPGRDGDFVEDGAVIDSKDPVNFEELINEAEVVLSELGDILKEARPKVSSVLTNLDGMLVENRPRINNILTNFELTSEYVMEFSEDIKYHPWKVLARGKQKTPEQLIRLREERIARKEAEGRGEEYISVPTKRKQGQGGFFF